MNVDVDEGLMKHFLNTQNIKREHGLLTSLNQTKKCLLVYFVKLWNNSLHNKEEKHQELIFLKN